MSDRPSHPTPGDFSATDPEELGTPGLAARVRDLENELAQLGDEVRATESRSATLESDAPPKGASARWERRLDDLADRIHGLAGEQQRLRSHFSRLLDHFDAAQGEGTASSASSPTPDTATADTSDEGPFPKRLLALGKALARRLRPAHPQRLVTLEPVAGPSAERLPTLGVVLPEFPDDEGEISKLFGAQTHPPDAVLRRSSSGDLDLDAGLRPPKLMLRPDPPTIPAEPSHIPWNRPLPRSLCELLRLLFASEDLDFAEIDLGEGDAWRCERPGGPKGRRLGKILTWSGDATSAVPLTSHDRLAVGRYRHLGNVLPRRHALRPLGGLQSAELPPPGSDGATGGVLLRLPSLLGGGDHLVATLTRSLGDRPLRVVLDSPTDPLGAERRRRLEGRFPSLAILPLGDVLAKAVRSSALAPITRRHALTRRVDGSSWAAFVPHLLDTEGHPTTLDGLTLPVEPTTGWPWWRLEGGPGEGFRSPGGGLRKWLGVPEGHLLVVHSSDLIPELRPEDFVTLARHLVDLPHCHFLMVGRGPLAGTVDDLARYAAHPRFRRLESLDPREFWGAADVACSTAPHAVDLPPLLAAMADGCPVIARSSALDSALTQGSAGIVAAGGVEDLGRALRELATSPDRLAELADGARRLSEPFAAPRSEAAWHQALELD